MREEYNKSPRTISFLLSDMSFISTLLGVLYSISVRFTVNCIYPPDLHHFELSFLISSDENIGDSVYYGERISGVYSPRRMSS